MPEKFGIEHIEKIFDFGVLLGKGISLDLKDGKLDFNEILTLLSQIAAIPGLIADKQALRNEVGNLSIAEIESLARRAESVINIAKVTSVIEHGIQAADGIYGLIQDLKPATPVVTPAPVTPKP